MEDALAIDGLGGGHGSVPFGWWLDVFEVVAESVEAFFPDRAVLLGPPGDVGEWTWVEAARSELGVSAALDQTGPFEDLDVFGNCREGHGERSCELVDGRLAVGEAGQDRASGRVGERGERLVEPFVVDEDFARSCSE